jgi:hypothetical protein
VDVACCKEKRDHVSYSIHVKSSVCLSFCMCIFENGEHKLY